MPTKKTNYIDNQELEYHLSILNMSYTDEVDRLVLDKGCTEKEARKKASGYISEELGEMFLKIANNYINRNNFNKYTNVYRDEMIGLAIEYLCRFAKRFDKDKSNANAFFYCTKICHNAYLQAIKKEKKKSDLKDAIIKEAMFDTEADKWAKSKSEFI